MTPILNFFYPEILNAVLIQGNTDLVVIKEQPLFDVNNTELTLSEKKYVNLLTIAVQHGAMCSITNDYYGYNTTIAPVNTYLNPNADIDTDNVHPTNQGHRHIYDAFKLVTQ